MDRRRFLQSLGASLGLASLGIGRVAFARAPTDRRFVLVVLRSGLDGLHAVPPWADPDYDSARGAMALPQDEILDLDGTFGLHPALAGLVPMWDAGQLGFVHAVGLPYRGRSHFDAQDVLENGTDRPHGRTDGWLNRALAALGDGAPPTVAIGASLPLVLRGDADASSVDPLREAVSGDAFLDQVAEMYRDDAILGPALDRALDTRAMIDEADVEDGDRGGRGRRASPSRLATATGRLLAAEDGPRIAVLEVGGWDTHQGQGLVTGGLANRLQALAEGLMALQDALGDAWPRTAMVAVSEFGRTVRGNGTNGTDHGTGGLVWLAGGAVAGGRVHGTWPGLATSALWEGRDLQPTTDVRAVLSAVLRDHLRVDEAALADRVFPGTADLPPMELIRG